MTEITHPHQSDSRVSLSAPDTSHPDKPELATELSSLWESFAKSAHSIIAWMKDLGTLTAENDDVDTEYLLPNGKSISLSSVADYQCAEIDSEAVRLAFTQLETEDYPVKDFAHHPNLEPQERLLILQKILEEHGLSVVNDPKINNYIIRCFGNDCFSALRSQDRIRFPGDLPGEKQSL